MSPAARRTRLARRRNCYRLRAWLPGGQSPVTPSALGPGARGEAVAIVVVKEQELKASESPSCPAKPFPGTRAMPGNDLSPSYPLRL